MASYTLVEILDRWRKTRTAHCSCLFCKIDQGTTGIYPYGYVTIAGSNYIRWRANNWRKPGSDWPNQSKTKTTVGWFFDNLGCDPKNVIYIYWEDMGCNINKPSLSTYYPTGSPEARRATYVANSKTGFNCSRCNEKNDYAAANQSNGTYLCYACRN